MNNAIQIGLALAIVGLGTAARAEDKYRITEAERAACEGDAINLCGSTYPDEDALLACMRSNLSRLTAGCRPVFIAGLRRRGIQ